MNRTYFTGWILIITLCSQAIFCSQAPSNTAENDGFEIVDENIKNNPEANQTTDEIFDIISRYDAKKLNEYLNIYPQAVNSRTPYSTSTSQAANWKGCFTMTWIDGGHLPLTHAILKADIPCIQVILNHMHNFNPKNQQNYLNKLYQELNITEETSYYQGPISFIDSAFACSIEDNDIIDQLIALASQEDKNKCLHSVINKKYSHHQQSNQTLIDFFLEKLRTAGADINYRYSCHGKTSLYDLVTHDMAHSVAADHLITDLKANPHLTYGDEENTLIHEAVQQGSWTISKGAAIGVIIKHGVAINTKNKYGQTPAHVAFKHKAIYSGFALARYGADLTLPDCYGKTAFDYYRELNSLDKDHTTKFKLYDCTDLVNDESDPNNRAKKLDAAIKEIHQQQLAAKQQK